MPHHATPILLATGNQDKQEAFLQLLQGLPLDPVTPQQAGVGPIPDETGDTHETIARGKAAGWSRAASMLAIASDGGLVIPALGELWESRYTHRFAGPAADDNERLERLLELMSSYQGADRQASWVEAVAIAHNGRVLASWEVRGGTGFIAETRESRGPVPEFWAFTIWHFPQFAKSYNQLTPAERASINDHWVRLGQLVRRYIRSVFVPPGS
jgi:inosine/xanthosine triphosphate pyrophosphatase family protein